ncbi:MAG: hypothetical protein MHPSP_001865, partial [Paramarteilia canceri]
EVQNYLSYFMYDVYKLDKKYEKERDRNAVPLEFMDPEQDNPQTAFGVAVTTDITFLNSRLAAC